MTEVITRSALELAALVRRREVSSTELLDAHLAAVRARDPELTAFVEVFESWARRATRQIDARRRRWPDPLPTFWGVPFAIKDNDPMRWTFTRVGSRSLRFAWTPFDSLGVRRLRDAGFVMLGKTTTSEFALLPVVEPDIHPPTRNPWDAAHTAGGSSGGAAAAVAAGMLPIAHGADGGGSIRIPAAFCGLFGFKASRGVMPHFYGPLESIELSVAGALARTVADSAAALDALCGVPVPRPNSWHQRAIAGAPRSLRVRFTAQTKIGTVHPDVDAAVRVVAAVLESMGHDVDEAGIFDGDIDEFVPVYGRLAANVPVLSEALLQPVTRWLRDVGRQYSNRDARRINARLGARVLDWFGDADIWVLPTVGHPAPRVGAFDGLGPREQFSAAAELGAFTAPFNITGQPAASIPVGKVGRLPIGVQIVGRARQDAVVLQVAQALHDAGAWRSAR